MSRKHKKMWGMSHVKDITQEDMDYYAKTGELPHSWHEQIKQEQKELERANKKNYKKYTLYDLKDFEYNG